VREREREMAEAVGVGSWEGVSLRGVIVRVERRDAIESVRMESRSRTGRLDVRENEERGGRMYLSRRLRLEARDSVRGGNMGSSPDARESGRARSSRSEARDDGRLIKVVTVTSRETGVGVGGWSFRQPADAVDDTVEAEPGILTVEASFLRALACTHLMSSANAWRSETGRVRGTERGAVRGTVGGVAPRRPVRIGVNRLVAGDAECWRTFVAALRVGGETVITGGGSDPKNSAGGSSVHPTQRPHVAGAIIDGELMVVNPTVVLKKWSNVISSSAVWSNVSASVPRSIGWQTSPWGGLLASISRKKECFSISFLPRRTSSGLRRLMSVTIHVLQLTQTADS
jgi:hypothetical protein